MRHGSSGKRGEGSGEGVRETASRFLLSTSVLMAFIPTRFKVKLSHVGAPSTGVGMTATLSSSNTSSLVLVDARLGWLQVAPWRQPMPGHGAGRARLHASRAPRHWFLRGTMVGETGGMHVLPAIRRLAGGATAPTGHDGGRSPTEREGRHPGGGPIRDCPVGLRGPPRRHDPLVVDCGCTTGEPIRDTGCATVAEAAG